MSDYEKVTPNDIEHSDNSAEAFSKKEKKTPLKIIVSVVAIILVVAVIVGLTFFSKNNKSEERPNLAIYLQGKQLKYSNLDEVNPVTIQDGYQFKKIQYGFVDYGKYYDTSSFIEDYIYLETNEIVYPNPLDDVEEKKPNVRMSALNLYDGTRTLGCQQVERLEKFYSQDKRYVYYTDIHVYHTDKGRNEEKYLQGYDLNKKENTFYIDNVDELVGVCYASEEIYYLKEQGTGKKELFKTNDGKKETRVDYGIISFRVFYSTGEAYYYKEDGLYYFNGESSKKVAENTSTYFMSEDFAANTAVAVVSSGSNLHIIIKDKVHSKKCLTEPNNVLVSSNGNAVFFLDNMHENGFYVGKVKYSSTNSMYAGDLYKISISGSTVSDAELFDTEVSNETVYIQKDGAVTYYKNFMRISSVVAFDFPIHPTVGDFYVNKKLVGEKVSFVEYISQNNIYYLCDVPNFKNTDGLIVKTIDDVDKVASLWSIFSEIEKPGNFTQGTLKKYDGTQSTVLEENVHEYYVKNNGQVLMITNYNTETCCGELYLYDESGNVFIDYDVTDIIRFD